MSGEKFNGFSQEEINRVSGQRATTMKAAKQPSSEAMRPATFRGHGGIRRVPDKTENVRQQRKMQTASQLGVNQNLAEKLKNFDANALDEIDLDNSMSKSIEEALFYQPLKKVLQPTETTSVAAPSNTRMKSTTLATTSTESPKNNAMKRANDLHIETAASSDDSSILKLDIHEESHHVSSSSSNSTEHDSSILPSTTPSTKTPTPFIQPSSLNVQSPFRGISLKDFETHRKMIEEQNRQKKDLLYKVIEQHSQKTAAEARKIEEIKAELSKLDNDLAIDVAVLRKQIEAACIHFAHVEKQYIKIESQFLKAKMDLHNAAEKKELLTEHLCTVIAHNEDRKAQKLGELMEKVGLSAENGEYEPPSSTSQP